MSEAASTPPVDGFGDTIAARPPGTGEFTLRAVLCSIAVAALIGAAYPYVVLKLGFGPNISVVSAFFGFIIMSAVLWIIRSRVPYNRWENNIVQTAGTSAGQCAFMCVLLAAFDLLNKDPNLPNKFNITPLESTLWLTIAGAMGVLLAVPLRRHYIEEEKLQFADGVAAAETLVVLDQQGGGARKRALSMLGATAASAVIAWFRDGVPKIIPGHLFFGAFGSTLKVGLEWGLLSFGSGMILGMRINLSMLLGSLISWVIIPPILADSGIIPKQTFGEAVRWVMWPATGLLVAGGLTAIVLKWRTLVRSFTALRGKKIVGEDFPLKWVIIGVCVLGVALCAVQRAMLGIPFWMTLIAILFSVPLMLVGLRVLGETNWGPISAMGNMMQAVFAAIAPGNISANMAASGVTGSIATESEGLMQDYKTGHIIGSTPRVLTYSQLIAIPVGAVAVSFVYPMLRTQYGIGGEGGLSSPISQKWAGFAQLLTDGFDKLPSGCFTALLIAIVAGSLLTVGESRWKKYLPSPTGIGIGMLVPNIAITMMVLGGITEWVWRRYWPQHADVHLIPVASGFIAGDAIIAIVIPMLVAFGLSI